MKAANNSNLKNGKPGPAARVYSTAPADAVAPAAKTRIYIVDDHPLMRMGLRVMISAEADMEVCGEAADSATATAEVMKLRPDLVVVDISLKGNSGIELIKNIKAFDPGIDVVVVSMYDESIYALRVLKAGARAYVMKQDVTTRVLDAIRRARNGQIYVSERVASQMLNRFVDGTDDGTGDSPVSSLSDRELEIVNLIGDGLPTREIASRLFLSIKTVETHRVHIKRKLNLANATQLVQFCVRWVEENKATAAAGVPPLQQAG
ncbi:MAG TPA: response regulator transcription factor [Opitutus sp.]|nr:response regulator transcription factor [Opitutus sp.]